MIRNEEWVKYLYYQIQEYCNLPSVSVRQTTAQFKMYDAGENIDERFRSRALAIVYNYLKFDDQNQCMTIREGAKSELYQFTVNHQKYSLEHFIINGSGKIAIEAGKEYSYRSINRYRDSVFNFIFVDENINNNIFKDHAFWEKTSLVTKDQIECPYSKMVFKRVINDFREYPKSYDETNYDGYFSNTFQREYGIFVANVVRAISERLNMPN